MVKVLLEEWATKNKIPLRTAQEWAKKEIIPAKLVDKEVVTKRKMKKYVIERSARSPR